MQLLAERHRADVVTAAGAALHADAGSVVPLAQLQILRPVVRPIPVDVVDGFFGPECATQHLGHDKPVFHDVPVSVGVRVLGTVDLPVPASREGDVGPRATCRAPAVSVDEAVRVAGVDPRCSRGPRGDGGLLTAAALAEPVAREDIGGELSPIDCHASNSSSMSITGHSPLEQGG